MEQPSPTEWLSQRQVAEILNCTERYVRKLIAQGKLPASRVGGGRMVRISSNDVQRLLKPIPTVGDGAA